MVVFQLLIVFSFVAFGAAVGHEPDHVAFEAELQKFNNDTVFEKRNEEAVEKRSGLIEPMCNLQMSDWMANVPDDQLLSLMSIPGTHQSCALYGGLAAECQTMTLKEQLDAGIRFLDIRCRVFGDGFTIHHAEYYQNIVFGEVLDRCIEFLNRHPSETILMRIQQEYSRASDQTFIKMFDAYKYKKGYKGKAYGNWIVQPSNGDIPKLQDVRGKIVIMSRVAGLDGIQWNSVDVDDHWSVPTIFDIPQKKSAVMNHLNVALLDHFKGGQKFYATFASGNGGGAFPYIVAQEVNPSLRGFISDGLSHYMDGRKNDYCYYGIIAMDFPHYYEFDIIRQIVKMNRNKLFVNKPVVTIYNTIYGHYMYASAFQQSALLVPTDRVVLGWEKGVVVRQAYWIELNFDGGFVIFYNTFYKEYLKADDLVQHNRRQIRTWIPGDCGALGTYWTKTQCYNGQTAIVDSYYKNYLYESSINFGDSRREIACWAPGIEVKRACWKITKVGTSG